MIYLTSDTHFWHTNVIRYCSRPFTKHIDILPHNASEIDKTNALRNDTIEMNETLITSWNQIVTPEDTIIHLGDFSMAYRSVELYTKRLNGKKILIAGNHDFVSSINKKSRNPENQSKWIQKYKDAGWDEVYEETILDIPGTAQVRLCHMPYADPDPSQDQRHLKHRPIDDGKTLLCGHVHTSWQTRRTPKGTLMINVGVDVWNYSPVSIDAISNLILSHKKSE